MRFFALPLFVSAFFGALPAAADVTLAVSPASATIDYGQTLQFAAMVTGTSNTGVTWMVNGIRGGNSKVGTISKSGFYTAPSSQNGNSIINATIAAVSVADPKKGAWALVRFNQVSPPPAINVSISPTAASLSPGQAKQFIASVTGTSNPAVAWYVNDMPGGSPTVGTVSSSGVYTAPQGGPSFATVKALSVADSTKFAQAGVTITPPVTVAVAPTIASIQLGQTQQFAATVSGTPNTAVTWTANGVTGGNSAVGTISPSGLYTAPSALPNPPSVTIMATSVVDQSKYASGILTIVVPVTVAVSPVSITLAAGQSQQFSAAVAGSTNTAVVWSLNPAIGSISTSGLYISPSSISVPEAVTVIATSAADNTKTAQAAVNLAPASSLAVVGGLVSYPVPVIGGNVLSNADFQQNDPKTGKPLGWNDNGFNLDPTVAHSGQASFRLTDANNIQYAQSASQTVDLKKGVYRIGGWIKTSNLAVTTGSGVRICLASPVSFPAKYGGGCTEVVKGSNDWTYLQQTSIAITQDGPAKFSLQTYGEPDGSAWFDDLELRQEQKPLDVFMAYPNYRGLLFDDQSQTARFDIAADLSNITATGGLLVRGEIVDEASSAVVVQQDISAAPSLTMAFDLSSLIGGRSYLASFRLIAMADGSERILFKHPAYRVIKTPGSQRASMQVSFDEQNRFLIKGKPAFILGVYDSGLGYTSTEPAWDSLLTTSRRLFELPINFYLNYWYGAAQNSSMFPMMDTLSKRGILAITNANCFSSSTVAQMGAPWYLGSPDSVVQQRGSYPGFGGFYAADECQASLAPDVFAHYQRMKALDPDGIVLGTLLPDGQLPLWRDSVDVLASDPYPMYGAEPAGGYPFTQVADGTRMTAQAVHNSRPFLTAMQFFKFTSQGRWPTEAELRGMSYAAIAEGANGLFYWSLGAGALAYICDGSDAYHSPSGSGSWCQAKIDNFANLKNVTSELKLLEPVLTMLDRPDLLAGNSNTPIIRTRVKFDGANMYLIAYNASASTQSATFRFTRPFSTVTVQFENRNLPATGSEFTDTFAPYQSHVYSLQ